MPSETNTQNRFLKVLLVFAAVAIAFLLLVNGVATYLLFQENKEKEALKKQLQEIESNSRK